ncbi:hypothetical protein, partial [Mycobacterium tuberculosis]|uniref:hypothetical protein n=1 Tax=Mycobacterium tuberculosis TaxID=1773 RepID=UPI001BE43167
FQGHLARRRCAPGRRAEEARDKAERGDDARRDGEHPLFAGQQRHGCVSSLAAIVDTPSG